MIREIRDYFFTGEVVRFIVNGLFATLVHFFMLQFLIKIVGDGSTVVLDYVAAVVGIAVSYLGNRFFVFRTNQFTALGQVMRFLILYGILAGLHSIILYVMEDLSSVNHVLSFLVATIIQVIFSFIGNKKVVFVG